MGPDSVSAEADSESGGADSESALLAAWSPPTGTDPAFICSPESALPWPPWSSPDPARSPPRFRHRPHRRARGQLAQSPHGMGNLFPADRAEAPTTRGRPTDQSPDAGG